MQDTKGGLTVFDRWEPLPRMLFGFAVHAFSSTEVAAGAGGVARADPADASGPGGRLGRSQVRDDVGVLHMADLQIGDEIYAFERFVPRSGGERNAWFRGYVVSTAGAPQEIPSEPSSLPSSSPSSTALPTTTSSSASPSSSNPLGSSRQPAARHLLTAAEPSVFLGIFPASFCHVREELDDADGRLAKAWMKTQGLRGEAAGAGPSALGLGGGGGGGGGGSSGGVLKGKGRATRMEALREEEEEEVDDFFDEPASSRVGENGNANGTGHGVIIGVTPEGKRGLVLKEAPPIPSLKAGDETARGVVLEPLIDEIACALREWANCMFSYLVDRKYILFRTVRELTLDLHLARKQLIDGTLRGDELASLRSRCVRALVKGNVVQGLDVIVRHPVSGALVTVPGSEVSTSTSSGPSFDSSVSAVRLFAMSVAAAYSTDSSDQTLTDSTTPNALEIAASKSAIPPRPRKLPPVAALDRNSVSLLPAAMTVAAARVRINGDRKPIRPTSNPARKPMLSSSSDTTSASESGEFYHLYFELRALVAQPCAPGETAELCLSLYSNSLRTFISEEHVVIVNSAGMPIHHQRDGGSTRIRALFMELGAQDVGDLFLVCRIIRCGEMRPGVQLPGSSVNSGGGSHTRPLTPSSHDGLDFSSPGPEGSPPLRFGTTQARSASGTAPFRRPFGCAVLDVSRSARDLGPVKPSEVAMQIFLPTDEGSFSTLHEDILQSRTNLFTRSPHAETLACDIKFIFGCPRTIIKENASLIQGCPQTQRLGFPDVVYPGQVRNDFYVKLWSADFSASAGGGSVRSRRGISTFGVGQSSAMSAYQVNVEVRSRDGIVQREAISRGSGEPGTRDFASLAFCKTATPSFGELIKISSIPADVYPTCHLFFKFRLRSTVRDKANPVDSSGLERPFAFAFVPLVPDTSFLPDGSHDLVLYRADKIDQLHLQPSHYLDLPPFHGVTARENPTPAPVSRSVVPLKDRLVIRTSLCSTTFTQSDVLLRLLSWEKTDASHNEVDLAALLHAFAFVSPIEICKRLKDVFDALFGLLIGLPPELQHLESAVFGALVAVLGIVQDRRFLNFKPVLEIYISQHFAAASVWSELLRSMGKLLAEDKTSQELRSAIKVWHYIFRFISRSREIQKMRDAELGGTSGSLTELLEAQFKSGLATLLRDFDDLMRLSQPSSIIGTQTLALQHFSDTLPDLVHTFEPSELADIVISFTDSIMGRPGKAIVWKLLLHLQTARSVVFDEPDARASLVPALVRWIRPHLGRYQEDASTMWQMDDPTSRDARRITWLECLRLAITTLAVMLDKLSDVVALPAGLTKRELTRERDNIDLIFTVFPLLLESFHEMQRTDTLEVIDHNRSLATVSTVPVVFPATYPFALVARASRPATASRDVSASDGINVILGEITVVLLTLINVQPAKSIHLYLEEQFEVEGQANLTRTLNSFFLAASSILRHEGAIPSAWINVTILSHVSLLKFAEQVARMMAVFAVDPEEFDLDLWRGCFDFMFTLLSSDQVVIEAFGPQRRRAVWRLAGDIRSEGSLILHSLWDGLGRPSDDGSPFRFGHHQTHFLSYVPRVLTLCLSHHDALRTSSVQILYTMILTEWFLRNNFDEVESQIVTCLDVILMQQGDGDDMTRSFFVASLRELFSKGDVDADLRDRALGFLDLVDHFLDLLLALRGLPEGEEYQDDRTVGQLRLLNFIRRLGGRGAMYINYVHKLVESHCKQGDWTEAGLTLRLHASLYSWSQTKFVEPFTFGDLHLPRQSEFGRKESLLLQTLDYLGRGKAYELAIEVGRELEDQHENHTFDYSRLAELISHRSRLLESIVAEPRPIPSYFLVSYYGPFPLAVRDRKFVHRGGDWEKLGPFSERLQAKHQNAQIIKSFEVSDQVKTGQEPTIQIIPIQPEPDRSHPIFAASVAKEIRSYHENGNLRTFSFSQPFSKSGQSSDFRDVADIWSLKTTLVTEERFPAVLRRSEVKSTTTKERNPLELALDDVLAKTAEIGALQAQYELLAQTGEDEINTNAFSMALNGVVDSPLDGGIPAYRRAFFTTRYLEVNPKHRSFVEDLRRAVDDLAVLVHHSLELHGQIVPESMIPFHATLIDFFEKTFAEEIARLPEINLSRPLLRVRPTAISTTGTAFSTTSLTGGGREHDLRRPSLPNGLSTLSIPSLPRSSTSTDLMGGNGGLAAAKLSTGSISRHSSSKKSSRLNRIGSLLGRPDPGV